MGMKVTVISDMHGKFPRVVAGCDLVLLNGDYFMDTDIYSQSRWLNGPFKKWIEHLHCPVVATWGNQDAIAYKTPYLVPPLKWHILVDQSIAINGVKIYGTPWTRKLTKERWSFTLDEDQLEKKWNAIPEDVNVLVLHSPPSLIGDMVYDISGTKWNHIGSKSLLKRIEKLDKLKLVTFGQAHTGHGTTILNGKVFVNASLVDAGYHARHKPINFTLDAP